MKRPCFRRRPAPTRRHCGQFLFGAQKSCENISSGVSDAMAKTSAI
jgi:hypothetical protein